MLRPSTIFLKKKIIHPVKAFYKTPLVGQNCHNKQNELIGWELLIQK